VIRVGLVGAGPWAGLFTAPMLAAAVDLTLAGVWARRTAAAEALAHEHGTVAVGSFDALLARSDAVAFAIPAEVQVPLAVAAARAGKHLLLEKPVGFTVAEAEEVAAAADRAGVATQLMLTYRFTPQVRSFLDAAARGRVGYVRTAFFGGGALAGSPFATPWRRSARAAVPDLGPHTLDLAEAAAGPIVQVRAAEAGGVVTVTTRHRDGASGHVAISLTTPGAGGLEAEAVTDAGRTVLADPTPHEPAAVWRAIGESFAAAVRGAAPAPLDVHRGVRLQRLLAAVDEAVDTGDAVSVGRP
jgi:predicted dehydrogenase